MPDISKNIDKSTVPGSIFVDKRNNNLIVAVKNIRKYTGLKDTPENRKRAELIKVEMYLELAGIKEKQVTKERRNFKRTFKEFKFEYCTNLELRTYEGYELAFRKIVTKDMLLTEENVEKLVMDFLKNNRKLSNSSINIYLRAFQVFLNYCSEKKYIPYLKIYKKHKKKTTQKPVEIYTQEEIDKLLDYFHNKDYEFKLLILLMLTTGMRIGECLKLAKSQFKGNQIMLGNKITRQSESVIISNELKEELFKLNNTDKVFRWKKSTYSRLARTLQSAIKLLGIEPNKSFHEFRKTFLRNLYDENTPVQIAQRLMRHSNINITISHYTKIRDSELNEYQNKVVQKYKL